MRKVIASFILCIVLAAGFFTSCSDTDCLATNTAYVSYVFYNENGRTVSLSDTVTVTAAGTDSVLINSEVSPSLFQLPLSYTNTVDTFIIHYTEKLIDSIFVTHTNIPHFISMDCGTGMYYYLDAISSTNNAIDSIMISNPTVDYNEKENVKIYYTSGV